MMHNKLITLVKDIMKIQNAKYEFKECFLNPLVEEMASFKRRTSMLEETARHAYLNTRGNNVYKPK